MKSLNKILLISLGALILLSIGLFNGYPLVYSDTGTYIYSGFDSFIPKDRPVTYGYLIKFISLKYSLWFVIIFQNLITSFIIFKTLKTLRISSKNFNFIFLSVILFLTFFSGIAWYTNQIMPDFFAPLLVLSLYILIFDKNLSFTDNIFLFLILIISITVHFSHLILSTFIILFITVAKLLSSKYLKQISFKKISLVFMVIFISWFIIPGINYITEQKFILSKSSHVFLTAHLVDTGILEKFLTEHCNDKEFKDLKLCRYKDSLPTDLASFLWSGNTLKNTGGWENSNEEYNKIIKAVIKNPEYLFMNIYKSITYGFIQLTRNDVGQGLTPYNKGSAPYGQIHWRFRNELNNYLNSKQNKWNGVNLSFKIINTIQTIILILSLLFFIYIFTSGKKYIKNNESYTFVVFILGAIIINAFSTAGINSPCSRFQARVVWMFPFALIIFMLKNYKLIFKHLLKRSKNIFY